MAKKKYGQCLGDVCLMGGGRAELRAELAGESKRYRRVERLFPYLRIVVAMSKAYIVVLVVISAFLSLFRAEALVGDKVL